MHPPIPKHTQPKSAQTWGRGQANIYKFCRICNIYNQFLQLCIKIDLSVLKLEAPNGPYSKRICYFAIGANVCTFKGETFPSIAQRDMLGEHF